MSYLNQYKDEGVVSNTNSKNVFFRTHGMRIKNSFFKLEPNVNVYMKCTDTIHWISSVSQCVMMKYLLNNMNIDKLDKIIKRVRSKYLNKVTYNSAYDGEFGILKSINKIKERLKNKLRNYASSYTIKIQKLDQFYHKVNKKRNISGDAKYDNILENIKKSIQKLVMIIVKIEDIIENVLEKKDNYDNFEKIKNIYKSDYELLEKYKKIKKRFEKKEKEMRKKYKNYDSNYDLCVFSGNLDHMIRKYTHGKICSMKKMDLNICPNMIFSADNAKGFRDFIAEQGVHIEIKKNGETYMTHENIVNEINKYFTIALKKEYYFDNNILRNIGLNMLCWKDIKYLKENIETYLLTNKNEKIELEKKKSEIMVAHNVLSTINNTQKIRRKLRLRIKKINEKIEKITKKINEMIEFLESDYEIHVDNEGDNKLFYPMGNWSDYNEKDKFFNVIQHYLSIDLIKKREDIMKKFRYYDVMKRKFLNDMECLKKSFNEYKKYTKYANISLREILLYLHDRYNMDENPNIRLELTITSCKSDLDIIKDVYGTCKLPLSDYLYKKININGEITTLRAYDLKRTNMGIPYVGSKRIRRPCSTILKKDGCPSYCEKPKDEARKTCIVKSRRRKMREKRKFVVEKAISGKP